jgi:hypothetical protein
VCAATESCQNGQCKAAGCATNRVDCSGPNTTDCECEGNGCCSGKCQNKHSNGTGQSYYDCVALGTYNQEQAIKACEAYGGAGSCFGGNCSQGAIVCGGDDCVCWGYSNQIAGKWYNGNGKGCWCPVSTDLTTWN